MMNDVVLNDKTPFASDLKTDEMYHRREISIRIVLKIYLKICSFLLVQEKNDVLDWNGDHLHTNLRRLYSRLRKYADESCTGIFILVPCILETLIERNAHLRCLRTAL